MKVAIVINELNIRGGTHKQVLRLCEYLEEQKIEMLLLTKYYDPEKTYPEFEKYHPVSLYDTFEEFQKHRSLFDKIRNTRRFLKMITKSLIFMTVVCNGLPVLQHSEKTRKWFGKSMICQVVSVLALVRGEKQEKVIRCNADSTDGLQAG